MIFELFVAIYSPVMFLISYYYYQTKTGLKSVYFARDALAIDIAAIISGSFIMFMALLNYYMNVNIIFCVLLLIGGSWQAMMHCAKWLVRNKLRGD